MNILRISVRTLFALLPGVAGAFSLSAVLASEIMLRRVEAMGLPITLHDRLQAWTHDLAGLAPLYLPRTALALALAMAAASLAAGRLARWQVVPHIIFGALALVLMHALLHGYAAPSALSATAAPIGLSLQGVAGGAGAYLFFVFTGQAHRSFPSGDGPGRA